MKALAIFLGVFMAATAMAGGDDVCPVHGCKMTPVELKLVYGMPSQAEFDEMRVAKTQFPHGKDYLLAGCVLRPKKSVEGFVCPECKKARETWLSARKPSR